MAEYHFIGGDNKTYGPYSLEQLRQHMAENRLNAQSQIQVDGGPLQPLSNFPELMSPGAPGPGPAPAYAPPAPGPTPGMPMTEAKPGKVQAIAIMTLIGGILATLGALMWALFTFCIWIPFIYGLVYGIMAIVNGSKMLGSRPWEGYRSAKTMGIMMIINIINCDMPSLVMGIIILVFLNDPQVSNYMRTAAQPGSAGRVGA